MKDKEEIKETEKPEEEKYESPFFATREEETEWNVRQMRASNRIEGMEPNPEYQAYTAKLRAEGLSSEEIIKRFIEWIKSKQK